MKNMIIPLEKNKKLQISYGVAGTRFGDCFIAWINQDLCFLGFINDNDSENDIVLELGSIWKNAEFTRDEENAKYLVQDIFADKYNGNLLVTGTDFQISVWRALIKIAPGEVVSYEDLAKSMIGIKYTRAAANAVACNNISYLIPCHRVVRKSGNIIKYRWGSSIKKALLDYEKDKYSPDRLIQG